MHHHNVLKYQAHMHIVNCAIFLCILFVRKRALYFVNGKLTLMPYLLRLFSFHEIDMNISSEHFTKNFQPTDFQRSFMKKRQAFESSTSLYVVVLQRQSWYLFGTFIDRITIFLGTTKKNRQLLRKYLSTHTYNDTFPTIHYTQTHSIM